MASKEFVKGAAHTAGSKLTEVILQTPQGQQALAYTATEIVAGTASMVGVGTAAVAAGTALAVAAAPIVAVGAVAVGGLFVVGQFLDWLNE